MPAYSPSFYVNEYMVLKALFVIFKKYTKTDIVFNIFFKLSIWAMVCHGNLSPAAE